MPPEVNRSLDRLVRYLVSCARAIELDIDEILSARWRKAHSGAYKHENFKHGAHVFLALYLHQHPLNPYFRKPAALELYFRQADEWMTAWDSSFATGPPITFAEWPPFILCRGLDLLGAEIDPARREDWASLIRWFVEKDLPKPFFFTAPNHEVWRLALAALAARVLHCPAWAEHAEFLATQMLACQTPEGFWEEGRHHGPSMKYNSLMLAAMALIARETGNAALRSAAARLASFMARWSFPDGVTVGAFDGRQSTSPGYFGCIVPGLELAPEGLTHLDRIMDFWDRAGWLDNPRAVGPSNWYTYFGVPFAAESLIYYSALPEAELGARSPLPLDADGSTLENHTPTFDALLRRQGPWAIALSSQMSDVPKDAQFIYRLERQSRIEVWHERASVVVGGGHSLITATHPLYNAWVESGYHEDPNGFSGQGKGDAGSPAMARRRSKYYPRAAASGTDGDRSWLELVFAHATVRFELVPAPDRLLIRFHYRAIGLEELRLALPLVLWRGARAFADDRPLSTTRTGRSAPARRDLRVECPLFGTRTTLTLPTSGRSHVLFPLWPVRTYGRLFQRENFDSFFSIALVETVLQRPGRSGSGEWRLTVE